MTPPTRFLADEMLGKLARWMRFLGFDVAYARNEGDDAILAEARRTRRFLLTRDAQLAERARGDPGSLLLSEMDPYDQLEEVVRRLALAVDRDAVLTRCGECNTVLESVDASHPRVPESVRARVDAGDTEVWACASCGRAYWEGSHTARILETLERHGSGSGRGS